MSGSAVPLPTGVDRATVESWLADAYAARHKLMTGTKSVRISYAQGDGQRSVEYTPANLAALNSYIAELNSMLGNTTQRRRAIGFTIR